MAKTTDETAFQHRKNLGAFMNPNPARRSKQSVCGVEVQGDQRFIRRVAKAVKLLAKLDDFEQTLLPGLQRVQQVASIKVRYPISRSKRRWRPVVKLDTVSSRVSVLGLASFLANEATFNRKFFELPRSRRIWNALSRNSELSLELECMQTQLVVVAKLGDLGEVDANEAESLEKTIQVHLGTLNGFAFPIRFRTWLEQSC